MPRKKSASNPEHDRMREEWMARLTSQPYRVEEVEKKDSLLTGKETPLSPYFEWVLRMGGILNLFDKE